MNKSGLILVLFLVVSLGMMGCGQGGTSQETENLKKEVEALKKQKEDEKLAKEKEDLQKQKDALTKEKQQLASEKKKAEEKKKAAEPKVEIRANVNDVRGFLELREGPSEQTNIIQNVDDGETVIVLQKGKTWCKVNYNGTIGYMGIKFLNFFPGD